MDYRPWCDHTNPQMHVYNIYYSWHLTRNSSAMAEHVNSALHMALPSSSFWHILEIRHRLVQMSHQSKMPNYLSLSLAQLRELQSQVVKIWRSILNCPWSGLDDECSSIELPTIQNEGVSANDLSHKCELKGKEHKLWSWSVKSISPPLSHSLERNFP